MIRAGIFALLLLSATATPAFAQPIDLSAHFARHNLTGTFVLLEPETEAVLVYDLARAVEQFEPASTFKIPNTLIALQVGIDPDSVFVWDGQPRMAPSWNQDQTLRQAFHRSTVWVYQEVARRVGHGVYRRYLSDYGNGDLNNDDYPIDTFWLVGPLKTSAFEQVEFLRAMDGGELLFDPEVVATTRELMIAEETEAYVLRAKTGWAYFGEDRPGVGWYVGSVEREGRTVYFALNVDIHRSEDAAQRVPLARAILTELGWLE